MEDSGFVDVMVGPGIDTFAGAGGEPNARAFEVFGYAFMATKPAQLTVIPPARVHIFYVLVDINDGTIFCLINAFLVFQVNFQDIGKSVPVV